MSSVNINGYRVLRAPGAAAPVNGQLAIFDGTRQQWVYQDYEVKTVVQAADQSVTNSTTFASATDLFLPLLASARYKLTGCLLWNAAGTTAGGKLQFTGPAAPTLVHYSSWAQNSSTVTTLGTPAAAFATPQAYAFASTGLKYGNVHGYISNGVNAGTLQLQFAQNVLDAVNAVTLKAGSWLELRRIP